MKKLIPYCVIVFLVLGGLGAVATPYTPTSTTEHISETVYFSAPTLILENEYLRVNIPESPHTTHEPGKPQLPMVPVSLDLPFGSHDIKITYSYTSENTLYIPGKIQPAPQYVILSPEYVQSDQPLEEDAVVYQSAQRFPAQRLDHKITAGLNQNSEHVTHLSLYIYPIQYSPAENTLYYTTDIMVQITYQPPKHPQTFPDVYDLVIIAPPEFTQKLEELVTHKNNNGMQTLLKTTDEIYIEYAGFDKPEQIKYFIKDAVETYGITYALLVGGLTSYYDAQDRDDTNQGSTAWYVPVRYTNIKYAGSVYDPGAACDLYYGDIYNATGNFSSWDSNSDGIYANWGRYPLNGTDTLDLNPDVYVSRLACRNERELNTVVKKIITYESSTPTSKAWMDTMVGIAGKTHAIYGGTPDGEYTVDLAFTYMEDIIDNEVRVYVSNQETGGLYPIPSHIIKAISDGAGYVLMTGHGNPMSWNTHKIDQGWIGGIDVYRQIFYHNFKKLPVFLVGGCHNAQFNVTWYRTKHSLDPEYKFYWTYNQPTPVCFCWELLMLPWGGAIASI
ncbi:MAG: hypothetical protein KKC68_08765, partial [Candidatus Thermoplasmatota archaeon]|nr:hypothetical protein [Candidatus Thermoplasmatota archaeon]